MDRRDIERRVAELDRDPGWYQNIDLGNGIQTKTRVIWGEDSDHPRRRWGGIEPVVPLDLQGVSVLDVGCNAGFVALEAARRGASDVVGVDLDARYIEQAEFCADVTGLPVRFERRSVYELAGLGRSFDLVFFVGLLYHCKMITHAINQIAAVAGGTVIVESAIELGHGDEPIVRYVGNDPTRPGTWHPSMRAMMDMFRVAGFADVEPVFQLGGRGGIIARRSG